MKITFRKHRERFHPLSHKIMVDGKEVGRIAMVQSGGPSGWYWYANSHNTYAAGVTFISADDAKRNVKEFLMGRKA